jgi:cytochrome d ubiquinol oxidase subunit II
MSLADALLAMLWAGLTVYAVLGGADFGAGVLHLLAARAVGGGWPSPRRWAPCGRPTTCGWCSSSPGC